MNRTYMLMAVTAAALSLAACSHNPSREQLGTLGGAVLGGAAGSVLTDGSTLGTVGGAAAGALIGQDLSKPHRH
jgi:osmotically inducible lipoprotein OsmB